MNFELFSLLATKIFRPSRVPDKFAPRKNIWKVEEKINFELSFSPR